MKLIVNIIVVILLCSPQMVIAVCVQGDCTNGHGTDIQPDESKYVGEFMDGMRNGQGEATYSDGTRYKGLWENNLPNGRGVKILADGTQYSGEFKNGLMYGRGWIVIPDGSKIKIKWLTDTEGISPQASAEDKVAVRKQIQKEVVNEIQSADAEEVKAEAVKHAGKEDGPKPGVIFPQKLETAKALEYASIAEGANIRSDASLTSKVLRTVPPGYPVVVLKRQEDWLLVEDYRGRKGWVYASLATKPGTVIIKVFKGNLRSGPSLKDNIIVQLDHGTILSVIERSGEWLKVSNFDELTGWMNFKVIWPAAEMNARKDG